MEGTQSGRIEPDYVRRECLRWARIAGFLTGYLCDVAWTEDRRAVLVALQPFPRVRSASTRRARAWAAWLTRFLTAARPVLEQLAAQGVAPRDVLTPIGRIEISRRAWERFHAASADTARHRRREAEALERAAVVLDQRAPAGPWVHHDGPEGAWRKAHVADHLRAVATGLRASAPARGPRAERVLLVAARVLDLVMTERTGHSNVAAINTLLHAAWPGLCGRGRVSADTDPDELDATRKLLARARARVSLAVVQRVAPGVPASVPTGAQNRPHSAPRQPTQETKTPQ